MLPDLPVLKEDIQSILMHYVQRKVHSRLGVFAEAPQHTIHEGTTMRIYRADGSIEETGMQHASAEMSIKFDEIPNMSLAQRMAKLNELAEAMAKQMGTILYKSLDDSLDKAGQVVNGEGKPFGVESVFAALEKIQVDFDDQGNAKDLTMAIPPSFAPRVQQMIQDEQNDPSIKKRHDEIMDRKRMEWRDREAARKLVG